MSTQENNPILGEIGAASSPIQFIFPETGITTAEELYNWLITQFTQANFPVSANIGTVGHMTLDINLRNILGNPNIGNYVVASAEITKTAETGYIFRIIATSIFDTGNIIKTKYFGRAVNGGYLTNTDWMSSNPSASDVGAVSKSGDTMTDNLNVPTINNGTPYTSANPPPGNLKEYTIDASSLDQNTYYPVTINLGALRNIRIEVGVSLDSGTKPDWSTHPRGFSCNFIETVTGSGWGVNPVDRTIYKANYCWSTVNPIGGVGQLENSSDEYIYVRGGGKYFFNISHNIQPVLRTTTFINNAGSQHEQSVSPTASPPFNIVMKNSQELNSGIYGPNNKPTAADIGAVSKSGDTMTGQLILQSSITAESPMMLNVGGTANGAILVRHIDGKYHQNSDPDDLYLNWTSKKAVRTGGDVRAEGNVFEKGQRVYSPNNPQESVQRMTRRAPTGDIHTWIPYGSAGMFYMDAPEQLNAPDNSWWHYIGMSHANPLGYIKILAYSLFDNRKYEKTCHAGGWSAWSLGYNEDYKPTAADIGAISKNGDTMTGNLTMSGASIKFDRPVTGGGWARGLVFRNQNGTIEEGGFSALGTADNPAYQYAFGKKGSGEWYDPQFGFVLDYANNANIRCEKLYVNGAPVYSQINPPAKFKSDWMIMGTSESLGSQTGTWLIRCNNGDTQDGASAQSTFILTRAQGNKGARSTICTSTGNPLWTNMYYYNNMQVYCLNDGSLRWAMIEINGSSISLRSDFSVDWSYCKISD